MEEFKIDSYIKGNKIPINVQKIGYWFNPEFKIVFYDTGIKNSFIFNLIENYWSYLPDNTTSKSENDDVPFNQIEVDLIGYEIAKYWSVRLEKYLQIFTKFLN